MKYLKSKSFQRYIAHGFVYFFLILISAVFLLPFFWMVRSSLMELQQIFQVPIHWFPNPVLFRNYILAFRYAPFARYFFNTILILTFVEFGVLFTSSLAAYSFARLRWSGRNFWFRLILTSMMLPGAATLIPVCLGWRALGFYGTYVPLIAPTFFGGGAFNIFLLRQFLLTIPRELEEAAIMDGAGYMRIYYAIILPLTRSAMIVVGVFTFITVWNDFFGPLIYLNREDTFTLALGLQQFRGSYNTNWNLLMAASTVTIIPTIFVFLFGQRYFIKGIQMTGLKG